MTLFKLNNYTIILSLNVFNITLLLIFCINQKNPLSLQHEFGNGSKMLVNQVNSFLNSLVDGTVPLQPSTHITVLLQPSTHITVHSTRREYHDLYEKNIE